MLIPCTTCLQNRLRLNNNNRERAKRTRSVTCKYTLQQLKEYQNMFNSIYLNSAINIYHTDCNRFNKQIDELVQNI